MADGRLFVVTAPSGAGKTSMVRAVVQRVSGLDISISCTTRKRRETERDGIDYLFISRENFLQRRDNNEFLEYAEVYGNLYATPIAALEKALQHRKDLILEIDWKGARRVREIFPTAVSIFILPPNMRVLEHRLRSRGTDDEEVISRRLLEAREDISHAGEFEYVIVNDSFEHALQHFESIVVAERCKSKYFSLQKFEEQQ